jgi:hypothetical protein
MTEVIPPRNAFTTVGCLEEEDFFVVDNTLYRKFQGKLWEIHLTEWAGTPSKEMPTGQMVIRLIDQ